MDNHRSAHVGRYIHTLPKVFYGFSLYATRVAIPTMSAIPYVEKMAVSAVVKSGSRTA